MILELILWLYLVTYHQNLKLNKLQLDSKLEHNL